jgi:DtxR family Mn-dependent transcriptional regulator
MAGKSSPKLRDAAASPPAEDADLTTTIRKYLAQVYRLADRSANPEGFVTTSALADALFVSPPAVNRMVSRLREMNLLEHEPYQGIRLTAEGEREALRQLRLHRIAEAFLVHVMSFKWHEIHEEADQLARGLSEPLVSRMYLMAGSPDFCPHGEPIPSEDGTVKELRDELLTSAAHNTPLVITRIRTREPDRLEYLAALHLIPGTPLEVLHAAPFNGPLQLRVGKEYRIVGHNLAEMIRVMPAQA